MVIAHRVTRQETGIAQRRELLLPVPFLDDVSAYEVPVVHGFLEGILVVPDDLLRFP